MLKSNIHAKYKYDYVEKQEDGYIYILPKGEVTEK